MHRPLALLLLGLLLAPSATADWGGRAELGLALDSNLNNGPGGDREAGAAAEAAVGADYRYRRLNGHVIDVDTRVRGSAETQAATLSAMQVQTRGRYRWRLGDGFSAPTLGLSAQVQWTDAGGRLRDRRGVRLAPLAEWPLTTTLSLRPSVAWEREWARGAVFDAERRHYGLELDIALRPDRLLYLGLGFQDGDVVLSAEAPPSLLMQSRAFASDPAFPGFTAYRVDGDTSLAWIGLNRGLRPGLAVDAQLRLIRTETDLGPRYDRQQLFLSLLKTW